jgi:23S rRNA (adenine2503-C2)-methyltransferase
MQTNKKVDGSAPSTSTRHKVDLRGLSHEQLQSLVEGLGLPSFRAKQIEEWVLVKHVTSFDEMTNLPKALREQLSATATLGGLEEVARQASVDGSKKYLVRFSDGTSVECVGMPNRNRLAVCVSTQAGCRMGCAFCATGASGFERSLSADEIYDQVAHVADDFGTRATSVVLMGQGEPFANYDASLAAMRLLNSPEGAGIGARHITVSTCGIIPMIRRFAREPEQFTLAVSLHSAIQSTRDQLMPGVKKYSLMRLYDAMGDYTDRTGRRPSYEYALISGVNDTEDQLAALSDFCRGTLAHVNLIQLNDCPGSKLKPSTDERAEQFVQRLTSVGVEATVRNSRGQDIDAACGQLHQRVMRSR